MQDGQDERERWWRYDAARHVLVVWVVVQPNAGRSAFAGLHDGVLKVRVAAPAVDNRANAALIDFLGTSLGLRPGAFTLVRGASGRRKTIAIAAGPEKAAVLARLAGL